MDLDPDRLIRPIGPFAIGAAGAIVSLKFAPGSSWQERLTNISAGALLAGFASPALCHYFSMDTAEMTNAMAFTVGLFGMNFVASAWVWVKNMQPSDFFPWVRRNGGSS